jgi:hypothetical protein
LYNFLSILKPHVNEAPGSSEYGNMVTWKTAIQPVSFW